MRKHCLIGIAWLAVVSIAFPDLVPAGEPKTRTPPSSPEKAVEAYFAALKAKDYPAAIQLLAQPYHDLVLYRYLADRTNAAHDAILAKFPVGAVRIRDAVMEDLTRTEAIEIISTDKVTSFCVRFGVRESLWTGVIAPKQTKEVETEYVAVKEGGGWKLLRPVTHDFLSGKVDAKDAEVKSSVKRDQSGTIYRIRFAREIDLIGKDALDRLSGEKLKGRKLAEALELLQRTAAVAEKVAAQTLAGKYKSADEADKAHQEELRREGLKPSAP
jgi:hypothetical protein